MKQAHTDWWDMSSSYIHKIMGKIIQANWSLPFLRQQKSDLDNNDKCTAIPGAGTYQRGVGGGGGINISSSYIHKIMENMI